MCAGILLYTCPFRSVFICPFVLFVTTSYMCLGGEHNCPPGYECTYLLVNRVCLYVCLSGCVLTTSSSSPVCSHHSKRMICITLFSWRFNYAIEKMKSSISILHPLFIYCPSGQMDMEKARLSATT